MTSPAWWAFGDSITAGTWLEDPLTQSWPAQLDAMAGGGKVRNLGVGGMAVAFADPASPTRMDDYVKAQLAAAAPADLPTRGVLFAGGANDLVRSVDMASTRQAVFDLTSWVGAHYPGMRFCPLTLTPLRTDHTSDPVVLSSRRATYNTWARAQYGMAQQLVDVGDLLCAGGTYADPRLYVDGLHPNLAGANVLAAGVFAVLRGRGLL